MFVEGEKCFVIDRQKEVQYEAKVVKVSNEQDDSGETKFFIHYLGWNSRWDRWVSEEDLIKDPVGDLEPVKDSKSGYKLNVATLSKKKAPVREALTEPRKKKPRITTERDTDFDVKIPSKFKKQLAEDWKRITQEGMQVPLPRHLTASEILTQFLDVKRKKYKGQRLEDFQGMVEGLTIFFNQAIPTHLLYPEERSQYDSIFSKNPELTPVHIYGAEHLLRIFIRIPALLKKTVMQPEEVGLVRDTMEGPGGFLTYLEERYDELFLDKYEPRTRPTVSA